MPLFVISSRGVGWITTRSPSGRSFVADAVAVANVHSSWDDGSPVVVLDGGPSGGLGRGRPGRCDEVPRDAGLAPGRPSADGGFRPSGPRTRHR